MSMYGKPLHHCFRMVHHSDRVCRTDLRGVQRRNWPVPKACRQTLVSRHSSTGRCEVRAGGRRDRCLLARHTVRACTSVRYMTVSSLLGDEAAPSSGDELSGAVALICPTSTRRSGRPLAMTDAGCAWLSWLVCYIRPSPTSGSKRLGSTNAAMTNSVGGTTPTGMARTDNSLQRSEHHLSRMSCSWKFGCPPGVLVEVPVTRPIWAVCSPRGIQPSPAIGCVYRTSTVLGSLTGAQLRTHSMVKYPLDFEWVRLYTQGHA